MTDVRLAVVIPTRNRASLTINAIRSLLDDKQARDVQVFVGDNSASDATAEVETLASFCNTYGDDRLVYMRAPRDLTMPQNWDWCVREAMRRGNATHFAVHYDRKVTKRGKLRELLSIANRFPQGVITHAVDFISIENGVHHLWQPPYTGKLYEIRAERVTSLIAQGRVWEMGHAFPILSNCVVPRFVLERVIERFGDLCDSTGPDAAFCMRFCALFDDFLHFNAPLGVLYAIQRSNGAGYLKGGGTSEFDDFMKMWGDRPWLHAAPLPGLNLGQNMLYHEYALVRAESDAARFPEIDREAYLRDLADGLKFVQDPEIHARLSAYLQSKGWDGAPVIEPVPLPPPSTEPTLAHRAAQTIARVLRQFHLFEPLVLFGARIGIAPRNLHGFAFRNDDEALPYALKFSRAPEPDERHLHLMEPKQIDV
ncbi:MAG: glycosyltransferase family 2 protein [Thermoanaerobaculia bacterium]